MPCCAEAGEILIIPAGGAEAEFVAPAEGGLSPLFSYQPPLREVEGEPPRVPAPWVGLVPEPELAEWLERLNSRDDVAVACRNWRVSLAAGRQPSAEGGFGRAAEEFLRLTGAGAAARGTGAAAHVAVIDSGVAPLAVCCEALNPIQLDYARLESGVQSPPLDEHGHGSLIAALIHRQAPAARISSIRAFRRGGTSLAEVVFGLLSISQLRDPVDLVNLSFSVDAAVDVCENCEWPSRGAEDIPGQLEAIFDQLALTLHPCPVFVAAAGTGSRLASPAAVPGVIAVDAVAATAPLRSARGRPIEGKDEFVLAAGGSQAYPIEVGAAKYYGSSFATAVLTGVLAGGPESLRESKRTRLGSRRRPQVELLRSIADRGAPGFDPELHGLGLVAGR